MDNQTYRSKRPTRCGETLSRLGLSPGPANFPAARAGGVPAAATPRPPAVAAMLARWPTIEEFRRKFSPTALFGWALRIRGRCLLTRVAPTLGMLAEGYGIEAASGWLAEQLINVNGLFNIPVDKQVQPSQCMVVASAWVSSHPSLKVSEVWVFLCDWMAGVYGKKLYGAIDLTEMGDDLARHIRSRRDAEYERRRVEERSRRDAMLGIGGGMGDSHGDGGGR